MPRERKKRFRWDILLWITAAALLLGLIVTAVSVYWLPYRDARSEMPAGSILTIQEKKNGHLEISWPEAEKRDFYHVEVLRLQQAEGEEEPQWRAVFSTYVSRGHSCPLPELPGDETVTIRVNTMVGYEHPGESKLRPGENPLEVQLKLDPPKIGNLQWTPDPEVDVLHVNFDRTPGDYVRLYCREETGDRLLRTEEAGEIAISFGDGADHPMPECGETCSFVLDSYREGEGYVFYSRLSQSVEAVREDLLGRELYLSAQEASDNVYTLTWNETKGETYQVQMQAGTDWVTLATLDRTEELTFTTDRLTAFRGYAFRIVAQGGQTVAGQEFAAMSRPVAVETDESLIYATIWPLMELEVFDTPDRTNAIGTVAAGSTCCVLKEEGGCFAIRYGEGVTGYIDASYCMIDLAEYLGDLCAYNITNSYSSKYKANKYDIPKVTGTVITGYEDVRLEDGTYLVPLLYPVAQRLMVAAQNARAEGYRLKIYDAYRPNKATVSLYSRAEKLQDEPVPGNKKDPDNEEELLTYAKVMTNNGQYPLNYFLARGYSKHNLGVAVDLTIEKLETGEECGMQTAMHDLSHYSVIYRNNKYARALDSFMKDAGFVGLVSEWWHFQDDEVRANQKLSPLWEGVSPEGWKFSPGGWRWRYADGTYASGCTLTIGEQEYTFDDWGYLVES